MPRLSEHGELATLSWGLFLLLALSAFFVAMGFPAEPLLMIGCTLVLLFTFRYIYFSLYLGMALVPFLGIIVSAPTGNLAFGQRAFGGVIDISLAEVILFFVLLSWGLRLLFLWWQRRDQNWRPRLPLIESMAMLFAAHAASIFSPLQPDPLPTLKYAFRPVLFDYLAFVALPVNLIRSRRRLVAALGVISMVGLLAALNGFLSMFFPSSGGLIGRAYPLSIFGINVLGENWNELADVLIFTAPFTLAFAELLKNWRTRRFWRLAAAFQFLIGLLTFTRTFWIVFALQTIFLVTFIWREAIKKYLATILVCMVLFMPVGAIMAAYVGSETVQGSNSTRLMLSEIAYNLFNTSPWLGAGAGTFLNVVGSTQAFLVEYGTPLDSHGFIQKIAAETGLFGLFALTALILQFAWIVKKGITHLQGSSFRDAYILIVAAAGGALAYQLFNTDYWTGKLWLPIGIALAALRAFQEPPARGMISE